MPTFFLHKTLINKVSDKHSAIAYKFDIFSLKEMGKAIQVS